MNQPIPERIKNKPCLKCGLELYYDAFHDLQFDRGNNDRIPWTTLVNYADRNKLSETQTERLIRFVRTLDFVYYKWLSNKRGKNE